VPSLFRAEQLFVSGDHTQARQYANAAFTNTDFAPLKARALIIAGKIQHLQGNFDMALKNYERALSDSPDNLLVLYLMAQILFQRREYDKAIDAIETALKVSPNEPNFLKVSFTSGHNRRRCSPGLNTSNSQLLVYIYARRDENETPKALQKWELMQAALRRQALAELKTTTPTSAIPPVLSAFEHVTDADFCLALARMFEKTGKTEQAIDGKFY
jgi:tetratricopeptide (TPR) repeat protein